jgi:hypothetical protein
VAAALALLLLTIGATRPVPIVAASRCELDGVERVVAVGDVHGAYDRFAGILRQAGILDDRDRWAGGRTHLVQTGDVLDRGPDSRKALDLLDRLEEEARRAGGAVHALLGNHEVMRVLGDLRYATPGEYDAFVTSQSERNRERYLDTLSGSRDQLRKQTPLGFVEMRLAFGRDGDYGRWFRTLNAVVKINGVLFLHGGISPSFATMSCDDINSTLRRELTAAIMETRFDPQTALAGREDGPLWYRGLATEPEGFAPKVDDILVKQNARAIVIGHTVAPAGRIRARFAGRVIQIDTGMQPAYIPDGRASALEIKNGELTAIYHDTREPIGAEAPLEPASR